MQCESCQHAEATIHLTQVVDGTVKKLHLCEECAAKSGLDMTGPISITDILLGMGAGKAPAPTDEEAAPAGPERSCPRCHMRRADFKKTGRLGCADCYEAFSGELLPLIKAMHRADQHAGKVPERERARVRQTAEVEELRQALERAVAAEKYEEAARLRDLLQRRRARDGGEAEPAP